MLPMARPVKSAPGSVTTVWAAILIVESQAAMLPFSVATRNVLGLPEFVTKADVLLKTMPVGLEVPPPGLGMVIAASCGVPLAVYVVTVPEPWLATKKGPVGPAAMPQGSFRFGSVVTALAAAVLATRLVWTAYEASDWVWLALVTVTVIRNTPFAEYVCEPTTLNVVDPTLPVMTPTLGVVPSPQLISAEN